MVTAQLNYFDMVVLSIMFLSCVFALFRGFVKEILSLIAWVGSAYITIRFYGPLAVTLQPHFVSPRAGSIAAGVLLYVGSLIGFFIFNRIVIKALKTETGIGLVDNLLGLIFGGLRGAFIISLGYLMIALVVKEDSRPDWLEKAVTRPYAEQGAIMLAKLAPKYTEDLSNMKDKAKEGVQGTVKEQMEKNIKDSWEEKEGFDPKVINPNNNQNNNQYNGNQDNIYDNQGEKSEDAVGGFNDFLKNLSTKP